MSIFIYYYLKIVILQRKSLQDLYDKKVKGLVEKLLQSHQLERSIWLVKLFFFLEMFSFCVKSYSFFYRTKDIQYEDFLWYIISLQ
jgi:hypothetical protein